MKKREKLVSQYKKLFSNKKYLKSFFIGILLLIFAGILSYVTISYAEKVASNSLSDLFLDNLPQLNLFWFRTIGVTIMFLSVLIAGLLRPKYLPILTKSIASMYIIRALFIPLTHLKIYPSKLLIPESYSIFSNATPGNDLFFSGHVSFPFIVALVFWKHKKTRYFFLLFSAISGIAALLAKTHYSIDVFAAPFITYSIFKIVEKIFPNDSKN